MVSHVGQTRRYRSQPQIDAIGKQWCIVDRCKGSSTGAVSKVGVFDPYELISGDAFVGTGHAGKAAIGGVGEGCG